MKVGYIYKLTFANGKCYVGLTTRTPEIRYKTHATASRSSNDLPVYRAWRKHGAPMLSTLETRPVSELAEAEMWAIIRNDSMYPNGCNLSYGGDTSPTLNPIVAAKVKATKSTPEARKRASEVGREVLNRPDVKARIRAAHRTPETRQRMAEAARLRWAKQKGA